MTLSVEIVAGVAEHYKAGMTYVAIADVLGVKTETVRHVIRSRGLNGNTPSFPGPKAVKFHANEARIRSLALEGRTRREIADELGVPYQSIVTWALRMGVVFADMRTAEARGIELNERLQNIVALYKAGCTLQQIGEEYGITRERVRQILAKDGTVSAQQGGQSVKAEKRRKRQEAKAEARCQHRHGCSVKQYRGLLTLGRKMMADGYGRATTPTGAFLSQKHNAHKRDIPFTLTLWEWWVIWQASGHWAERGRGHGYVMARIADEGGYEVGNVFITTGCINSSEGQKRKGGKRYTPKVQHILQADELARAVA